MLAILHFDNTVEMILRTIATIENINPSRKKQHLEFPDLVRLIDNLPLKEQIESMHRMRNGIQHQGDVPSIESVVKYKGYTGDFVRKMCTDRFKISYDEVFLSQLIFNKNLRNKVTDAEKAFEKGNYRSCITQCAEVFSSVVFDETELFLAAGELTGYWGASSELKEVMRDDYAERYRSESFYGLAKELRGAILQWGQAATSMQFLGEHRMDFLRHMQIVKNLDKFSESDLEDRAQFSLDFAIAVILEWQEQGVLATTKSNNQTSDIDLLDNLG